MSLPSRRAHVLQHVPFEDLGSIEPWLIAAGYSITWTRFHAGENLPAPADVDLLIVLGGPMSANDETTLPWLRDEKRFLRRAIETGGPLLGICLGAQLIASALGTRVYANRHREIGWFPVYRTPVDGARIDALSAAPRSELGGSGVSRVFPERFDAFHWHAETFDLPTGAELLARSEACEHQAFAIGSSIVGLQFHLEAGPASARRLIRHCRDELVAGPYVQTEEVILATNPGRHERANMLMAQLLRVITSTGTGD